MNLFEQFNDIFDKKELAVATITAAKGATRMVATTESGAVIILNGKADVGKKVYYDRRSNNIESDAPNIMSYDYPV